MKKNLILVLIILSFMFPISVSYISAETYPEASSCVDFGSSKTDCERGRSSTGERWGCAFNDKYKFCSVSGLAYLSCGSGDTIAYDIPEILPRLTSYAIIALKTVTPVILIIMSMIQLLKAVSSQNDDEIKKAKTNLVKKAIAAVMVFLLISIVQFVVKQTADDSESKSVQACLECFVNNDCGKIAYYTDGYGKCYSVYSRSSKTCPVEKY